MPAPASQTEKTRDAPRASPRSEICCPVDLETDLECAQLPLTDLGNAERWRRRFGADFRFCAQIGWFMWDGRRWRLLSEEKDAVPAEVMQSVFKTVRAIRNEAALIGALGCEDPEELDGRRRENFQIWAMAQSQRAWARLERTIRAAFPSNEDGSASDESDKAVERASAFIAKCRMRDRAIETRPDRRKLWSQLIAAHAKASETRARMVAVAQIARAFEDIAIDPDALNRDKMAINVMNGTLRFVPRRVRRAPEEVAAGKSAWKTQGFKVVREPHRREDLITKLANVTYRPSAKCPLWDRFLEQVQPDAVMRRFVHQWFGISLTGDAKVQALSFFYGSGRNGKGTAVETIAYIAGDYAGSVPIESFLDNGIKRRGDQATPDLARLPGVRFLRVSEPERGARLNEGLIKTVTGGDPVDARHLNKGFFTFLPEFKMTISGNHRPDVKDTSDGIWRRLKLVPWDVTIAKEDVDPLLPEKLREEASGILNRLLEEVCQWLADGRALLEPEQVRLATEEYRGDSDELGQFLKACCEIGEDLPDRPLRVGAKELHDAYLAWCEMAGAAGWSIKGFGKAMLDKKFRKKTSDGVKWLGVRLKDGVNAETIRDGTARLSDENGEIGAQNRQETGAFGEAQEIPGDD